MAMIPINNETEYALTDTMRDEILRDAHEHFGSDVRLIRVQAGLTRHALNARTREVRYAFSPQDFGLGVSLPFGPPPPIEPVVRPIWGRRTRRRAAPAPFEEMAEEEALAPGEVSMASLETGRDDDPEEDDPYHADDRTEEKSFLEAAEADEEEEAPPY